jgi:hypothetical protein
MYRRGREEERLRGITIGRPDKGEERDINARSSYNNEETSYLIISGHYINLKYWRKRRG